MTERVWYCEPQRVAANADGNAGGNADGNAGGNAESALPVTDAAGQHLFDLWSARRTYDTPSGRLDVQVIAVEPVTWPTATADEPAVGVLARIQQGCQPGQAALCVHSPRHCFSDDQAHLLEGIRLVGIHDEADQQWWDAVLNRGQLCYAVTGRLRIALQAVRTNPSALFVGLACGLFVCEQGLAVTAFSEERHHTRWQWDDPNATTVVIIRGGFEAARLGAADSWQDSGSEGYVRLLGQKTGGGQVLTQPRMVLGAAHGG